MGKVDTLEQQQVKDQKYFYVDYIYQLMVSKSCLTCVFLWLYAAHSAAGAPDDEGPSCEQAS